MKLLRTALLALIPLAVAAVPACGIDEASDPDPQGHGLDLENRYGFVSLVDGTMGVVDLETMAVVNRVDESSYASHMLYKLQGRREVLYGDWDTNEIVRIGFSDDMREHEELERVHSPVAMHGFMTLPPDDRTIVVTSRLELKDKLAFDVDADDTAVGLYDTHTGDWRVVPTGSPSYSALGPDGRLYVTNVHHQTVSVVDLGSAAVVETLRVGPESWVSGDGALGPKGLAFSPDGRRLVTADYEGMTLTVFDVTEAGLDRRRVVELDGVPKAATFTRDGKELWVVLFDLTDTRDAIVARTGELEPMGEWYEGPDPGNEVANAYRNTTMVILDGETLEPVDSFPSDRAMISPRATPDDPNVMYVTTSAGSVLAIDRTTHRVIGEAAVGRIGMPVVCGNLAL